VVKKQLLVCIDLNLATVFSKEYWHTGRWLRVETLSSIPMDDGEVSFARAFRKYALFIVNSVIKMQWIQLNM
jgi:hypothetical protein